MFKKYINEIISKKQWGGKEAGNTQFRAKNSS